MIDSGDGGGVFPGAPGAGSISIEDWWWGLCKLWIGSILWFLTVVQPCFCHLLSLPSLVPQPHGRFYEFYPSSFSRLLSWHSARVSFCWLQLRSWLMQVVSCSKVPRLWYNSHLNGTGNQQECTGWWLNAIPSERKRQNECLRQVSGSILPTS